MSLSGSPLPALPPQLSLSSSAAVGSGNKSRRDKRRHHHHPSSSDSEAITSCTQVHIQDPSSITWSWIRQTVLHLPHDIVGVGTISDNHNKNKNKNHPHDHQRKLLELLDLSIRLDESRGGVAALREPLESGRLYDSPIKFFRAYLYLQRQTKPPQHLQNSHGKKQQQLLQLQQRRHNNIQSKMADKITCINSNEQTASSSSSSDKTTTTTTTMVLSLIEEDEMFQRLPALTPVILSGLLTALQHNSTKTMTKTTTMHHDDENDEDDDDYYIVKPEELILASHNLRRRALNRLRARQRQAHIQRRIVPALAAGVLIFLLYHHLQHLAEILDHLNFGSCHAYYNKQSSTSIINQKSGDRRSNYHYESCRQWEANLWLLWRDYAWKTMTPSNNNKEHYQPCHMDRYTHELPTSVPGFISTKYHHRAKTGNIHKNKNKNNRHHQGAISSNDHDDDDDDDQDSDNYSNGNRNSHDMTSPCSHAALQYRYVESPFAMHTVWKRQLITLDEIDHGTKLLSVHSKGSKYSYLSESLVHAVAYVKALNFNLYTIPSRPQQQHQIRILDAGCGVGGSLYYFFPEDDYLTKKRTHEQENKTLRYSFEYTGIALSQAEVQFANALAKFHGLGDDPQAVQFHQASYDDPQAVFVKPNYYSMILAIESLSYAPDIKQTVRNLLQTLQPNGMMLIADEYLDQPTLDSDITPPWNKKPKLQPSLLYYNEWKDILEEEGCKLIYIRDLALDYEMDTTYSSSFQVLYQGYRKNVGNNDNNDNDNDGNNKPSPLWWGASHPQWFLYWLSRSFLGASSLVLPTNWQRIVELQAGIQDWVQTLGLRQELYESAQSSYFLVACQKQPQPQHEPSPRPAAASAMDGTTHGGAITAESTTVVAASAVDGTKHGGAITAKSTTVVAASAVDGTTHGRTITAESTTVVAASAVDRTADGRVDAPTETNTTVVGVAVEIQ